MKIEAINYLIENNRTSFNETCTVNQLYFSIFAQSIIISKKKKKLALYEPTLLSQSLAILNGPQFARVFSLDSGKEGDAKGNWC